MLIHQMLKNNNGQRSEESLSSNSNLSQNRAALFEAKESHVPNDPHSFSAYLTGIDQGTSTSCNFLKFIERTNSRTICKKQPGLYKESAMMYDVAYIFIFCKASSLHGYIEMPDRYDLLEVSVRQR